MHNNYSHTRFMSKNEKKKKEKEKPVMGQLSTICTA